MERYLNGVTFSVAQLHYLIFVEMIFALTLFWSFEMIPENFPF